MTFDPEKAIASPSTYYGNPQEVLDDSRLTREQKFKVLKSMEEDAVELMTAVEENMPGGEEMDLEAIRAALHRLEKELS